MHNEVGTCTEIFPQPLHSLQLLQMNSATSRGSLEAADKDNSSGRRFNAPVITISREQLDELRSALENASDLLREVGMNSVELDAQRRQSRSEFSVTTS